MLVTNLTSENYYTEGENRSIKKMMDETYSQAVTINQAFWSEADIDTRFKVGDQAQFDDYYGNLPAFRRKQFYFNRIRRVCNLITGYQRRNRKSTVAVPVEHNDDVGSSQWSKLLFHTMKKANADEMISEAFEHGAVTTGMSLLNMWIDYTQDGISGDIKLDHVPYNSFLIDPYFKKRDLSDCNFIWRRQWLSKDALKSIMPEDMEDFLDGIQPRGNRDGKFQFMAESYNYGMTNLLSYDEYWYRDTRMATFVEDLNIGLSIEWQGDEEGLKQFLLSYPGVATRQRIVPTVKVALSVEGKVVYDGPNPMGIDRYPFVPFIGYYEPNIPYFPWRVQGVVRGLRDSQFLYNRRKVIELDILESQINSGYKYKPGSLVNPNDVFLSGQGKGLAIKDGKDMSDVERIPPADIPPSMIQLSEILGREVQEISGVNEELLGTADDDKAGILSMLRQGAGLTTLQTLFDQLDFSQKLLGEMMVETMRKNYRIGKIGRILGEQPSPEFKYKVWLNYDIRIEEGVNTTTQRQMEFQQLIHLKEMGLPIPDSRIIQAATLQDKDELVATMQQESQAQQQIAQQQMATQMQVLEAQISDLQAKAVANQGLGVERISRVQENRALAVERLSQSRENRQDAALSMAKTIKELQGIDLNQIQQLVQIIQMLKEASQSEPSEAPLAVAEQREEEAMPQAFQLSDQSPYGY
jgi:hypothetical protein